MSSPSVRVHVATINTAAATELCIRTMHRFAGRAFELVVGDGGSTDGSLPMLQRFADHGWLDLEIVPEGRRHAQWLNHWLETCPARYAVFVDSDMEFLRDGWLVDLVAAAVARNAAMVTSRVQELASGPDQVDKTGAPLRWAPRPTPWLILVDVEQVRGVVTTGFGFRTTPDPERPGGKVAYDTGAAFFADLDRHGLVWEAMPDGWSDCYHHYGGMTWVREHRLGPARRLKLKAKEARIVWRMHHARRTARVPISQRLADR